MRSVIQQSILLPARAETLYSSYLDPAIHAAITGSPVQIAPQPGAEFSAFGGALSGQVLTLVAPRLIVQSWRSTQFKDSDPASTLLLAFSDQGAGQGRIDLIHLDVPDHDNQGVTEGWEKFYWTPWRAYLAATR